MKTLDICITNEYKALLRNATVAFFIVLFSIMWINIALLLVSPIWEIGLFVTLGLLANAISAMLLYAAIKSLTICRDMIILVKLIISFLCLIVSLTPAMLFIYLNLDWEILVVHGKMAIEIYRSVDNMLLPIGIVVLLSLIYWILTIQLYKKSYKTYLCLNKKKEIYGN